MRSRPHLRYLIENLGTMLLYEAIPLVFAPDGSRHLAEIGVDSFLVFAFSLVIGLDDLEEPGHQQTGT